jgi:GxxExxY protein
MELNRITERIIGSASMVHKELGPGLLESLYEAALIIELEREGLRVERQKVLPVMYREQKIGNHRLLKHGIRRFIL